jgi:hypothetical protein
MGKERDFGGMTMGWVAQLNLPESGKIDGATWEPMQIARDSKWAWTKGTKVALLDDAEGNTWILKGFQLGLNPQQTWEEYLAKGAASYKTLPAGHDHDGRAFSRVGQVRAGHDQLQAVRSPTRRCTGQPFRYAPLPPVSLNVLQFIAVASTESSPRA